MDNLKRNKVDLKRVRLIRGWYNETLNSETKQQLALNRAAIVHIDCDLYQSTASALEFVTDLIGEGSIIIFHDWWMYNGNPSKGEQKAFHEWRAKNQSRFQLEEFASLSAKAFIVSGHDG